MFLRHELTAIVHAHLVGYPTPANINYFWGFGSTAGLLLGCQIVTGVLLAMHYAPTTELAFASLEHIMRDVNYGWFLRYLHANGASFFFIAVYCHLGRSFIYGLYTYARRFLWFSGLVMFFLMMAIAFMGYVLPWGQMSFWGATVITNLFSVVPLAGEDIAYWLWGGFSVGNATLNRFFSLHFCLPFLLAAVVLVHIAVLHSVGSTSVLGVTKLSDKIFFYPYFYVKDYFGVLWVGTVFLGVVSYAPDLLGHSDNYILANPLVTPTHIVPEWYFLPYYALLRSIPNKLAGVVVMGLSICVCLVLPFFSVPLRSQYAQGRLLYRWLSWSFVYVFILLGFLGGQPIETPYSEFAQLFAVCYFLFFLLIVALDYLHTNFLFVTYSATGKHAAGARFGFFSLFGRGAVERSHWLLPKVVRWRRWRLLVRRLLRRGMGPQTVFSRWVVKRHSALGGSGVGPANRKRFLRVLVYGLRPQSSATSLASRPVSAVQFLAFWTWTLELVSRLAESYMLSHARYLRRARALYLKSATILEPEYRHPFHLVTHSPWPFSISFAIGLVLLGTAAFFHRYAISNELLFYGFGFLFYVMFRWFVDISREGTLEGSHLGRVQDGLKSGMLLFITSEVLFFFAFFWGFFHSSLAPAIQIGGVWPPAGITVFNPWDVPLLNTVILLTSGATVTWAHFAIRTSTKAGLRPQTGHRVRAGAKGRQLWRSKSTVLRLLALRLLLGARSSVTRSHSDRNRLSPMPRVRVLVGFHAFLELARAAFVEVVAQEVEARKSNGWRFLAIRRQVLELGSGTSSLLWRSVVGVGQSGSLSRRFVFRVRRSRLLLKRWGAGLVRYLRERTFETERFSRDSLKVFFFRSRWVAQMYRPVFCPTRGTWAISDPLAFRVCYGLPSRGFFVFRHNRGREVLRERLIWSCRTAWRQLRCGQERWAGLLGASDRGFQSTRSLRYSSLAHLRRGKTGAVSLRIRKTSMTGQGFGVVFPHLFRSLVELNPFLVYRGVFDICRFQLTALHGFLSTSREEVLLGLRLTIGLGALFTLIQYYEYTHATFTIADSVYGTTFFLTTGFHGLHVLIGTLLLFVSYLRMQRYQFTLTHHVGLESAIWYWHFVDVVWLGLYLSIYHWGG